MNLFPLLLLAVLLGGEKLRSVTEFLARIDFKSFAPILKLLGLSDQTVDFLSSDEFSSILEGKGDASALLKSLGGVFSPKKENDAEDSAPSEKTNNFLSPIEDVAPTEIERSLGAYFA